MTAYRWRCLACETVNLPAAAQCSYCGCPARPRHADIVRCARLAALRADKVFPPADAEPPVADPRRPTPLRTACTVAAVLASWAVLALLARLAMAPVAATPTGGWLLAAMMATFVLLALLTAVIVYRSAQRAALTSQDMQ